MPKLNSRPLSIASRLWIAVGRISPPCANQLTFEGPGTLDPDAWRAAVLAAATANPGTRLVLRGSLGSSRWVDSGTAPRVREADASGWDGMGSDGAPFLMESFDPRNGPNAEVLLMHGNPARVSFRSHHAVMDGRGAATWAEDVFRALRGEEPAGSEYTMTENDLLNFVPGSAARPLPHHNLAPTGAADGSDVSPVWRRKTIRGKVDSLLPKVILCAARAARRHADGPVRIGVPVDLRRRCEGLRSTGNLTNAIYIDIPGEAGCEDIAGMITERLERRSDGEITWEDSIIRYVPVRLLGRAIAAEGARNRRSGGYRCSGFVSNLGRLEIGRFACNDFSPTTYYGVPVCAPIVPFSMTLSGTAAGIELLLAMPRCMSTGGRIGAALDAIERELMTP
ncbi:MAG TPA: hypothetical protein PK307_10695 [Spirochaetota bacterium]|nr:hypothetical protein [Spirochaetota bacterium]HPG50622.1 hypothetical protein [Spirochaetota bacterium]HPN13551.1 hypothetical protein [Spirochaetota bacterium]HQL82662.1 hypothetical protein [Spirochaetota bacterium]